MLPPIYIDLSEVASEFVLSEEEIKLLSKSILSDVMNTFEKAWERFAGEQLHSTRDLYMRAMYSKWEGDYSIIFGLNPMESPLIMMLENGASSWDIKEGFKKSDKAKNKGTDDWYLTVPFKWATSEAIGESEMFSNKMPKPIEKLVKTSKSPLKLGDLPQGYTKLGQNKTSKYEHKFSIYEGLSRQQIGSGTENRGGYMSFRRVSENSDKGAWIHPGFTSLNLMEKASDEVDIGQIVDFSVDQFLSQR